MFSEAIGRLYKNHIVIGNGSFGKVFSAQRVSDSKTVAVKEVDTTGAGLAERTIILAEYTYYPNIVDPNVVTCYTTHFDKASGQLYLEMEYCPGGSLSDLIKSQRVKKQPLPERDIWRIFKGLASALVYLHSPEKKPTVGAIIHRDIKPANIVFSKDGVAKICDFGLSRGLHELSIASSKVGTDVYMAPEVNDGEYNEKVDVWSLGCVILELCSLHKPKPRDPIILEAYSPQLASILRSCLTVSPNDRISSARLLHLLSIQESEALSRKPSTYYGLDDNDEDTEEDAGDLELREQKEKIRAQEQMQQECNAEAVVEETVKTETDAEIESLVFFDQNITVPTLHTIQAEDSTEYCSQLDETSVIHEAPDLMATSILKQLDFLSRDPEVVRSLLLQYASALETRDNEIAQLKGLLSLQNQQFPSSMTRPSVETPIRMSNDTHAESIDFTIKEPTQFGTVTEKESICPSPRSFDCSMGIVLDDLVANQHRLKTNIEVDILQRSIKAKDAIIDSMKKQSEVDAKGTKVFIEALYKDINTLESEVREKNIIIEELCEAIDKNSTLLDSAKRRESLGRSTDGSFTDRSKSATPEGRRPRRNSLYSSDIADREQEIQHLKDELIRQQAESAALREQKFIKQECIIQDLTASLRAANAEIDSLRQKVALQSPLQGSLCSNTPTVVKMPSLELSQYVFQINELEQIKETLSEELEAKDLTIQQLREAILHQEISFTKLREVSEATQAENRKLHDTIRMQAGTISALVRKRSPQLPSNTSPPSKQ
ncbi:Kinase, NEK [Giardia lamblia P15]|uniref:non-specific serine/threonine protein kinase n=1 Tax=Giardia intestinalis (strain P15) TaxID=658858 RepID=E1F9P7_GIAIA|nr:Kinase, NEK [Giardia lamblia P15]